MEDGLLALLETVFVESRPMHRLLRSERGSMRKGSSSGCRTVLEPKTVELYCLFVFISLPPASALDQVS